MYIYIFLNILERPFESGSTQQTFGSGLLMMLNNCEIGSLFCYLLFWLFVSTNHPGILTVGSWNSRLRDWWIPGFQTQPGGMENNSPFSVQFFELVVFFFYIFWCHMMPWLFFCWLCFWYLLVVPLLPSLITTCVMNMCTHSIQDIYSECVCKCYTYILFIYNICPPQWLHPERSCSMGVALRVDLE